MPRHLWKFPFALIALLTATAGQAGSATEARLEALKEQNTLYVEALKESQQKDQQLFRQQLDAQKELIASQNEKIEAFSSRIGDLNLYLAIYAVLGTLLGLGVAFLAYLSAGSKARQEAEKWFEENARKLHSRIAELSNELEQHAQTARQQMKQATDGVEMQSAEAMKTMQAQIGGSQPLSLTEESASALKAEDEQRKHKPETEYYFDDWNTRAFAAYYENKLSRAADFWGQAAEASDATNTQTAQALFNKGVALGQQGRTDEEVACYDQVLARFGEAKEPPLQDQVARALVNKGVALGQQGRAGEEVACYDQVLALFGEAKVTALQQQVAQALFNKGFALGRQGHAGEEVACYDQVLARFGEAKEHPLQDQVAKARNGKGFNLLLQAKQQWGQAQKRLSKLTSALNLFQDALLTAATESSPVIQGNIAYALWLLDRKPEAEALLRGALRSGGKNLYDCEIADTELHTVSEDAGFRELVERLWAEINISGTDEASHH